MSLVYTSPSIIWSRFQSTWKLCGCLVALMHFWCRSQGCNLVVRSGPWHLTFPPGWLENLNHKLGTLDFTSSEHWAPFNFYLSTALGHWIIMSQCKVSSCTYSLKYTTEKEWSVIYMRTVFVMQYVILLQIVMVSPGTQSQSRTIESHF